MRLKLSSVLLAAALSMSLATLAPAAHSAGSTTNANGAPVVLAPNAPALAAAVAKIHEGKIDVNGVRYHYLLAIGHGTPIVLLHGWASTSFMWRCVMPQLVARGYTVLAPDLRGLGDTAKPAAGYEKANIAEDIHALVAQLHLGSEVNVVGHDMGGMVAYAYAAQHPDDVRSVAILDVPLPGIEPWDQIVQMPRTWHFRFYAVQDLPEMLIAGRELAYLKWFHNSEAVNSRAFTNEVEETYTREYAMPGALRAGFEYYRAFPADARQNQAFAQHKLTMPVLGIGGAGSLGPIVGEELRHVALDVQSVQIDGAGHWVAEEQPETVTDALLKFLPPPR
ncbi:Soluble epoxide hydrolase [Paraburkholderia ultramafica]|uniref:Soluble epoxide hydrolase n=1 Tax=Paraburkholderia ultramafica TaxID=1544867 RepID=A0A6S7B3N4_9BURK|nr:alpha/beta hydrolase [Paraburkholderia ultramafica]CAB3784437.1 Soluble epoxide hydrolase [Paraburkholderia ultramafica]